MAKAYYMCALTAILMAHIFGGIADLTLYLEGRPTITYFLRCNPDWFWAPAISMLVFILAMVIHLYGPQR